VLEEALEEEEALVEGADDDEDDEEEGEGARARRWAGLRAPADDIGAAGLLSSV
jgi:hypothetical protein